MHSVLRTHMYVQSAQLILALQHQESRTNIYTSFWSQIPVSGTIRCQRLGYTSDIIRITLSGALSFLIYLQVANSDLAAMFDSESLK